MSTGTAGAGSDRLLAAVREARDDAAPFALACAGLLVALAVISKYADWTLLSLNLWWAWLIVAAPWLVLSVVLLLGLSQLAEHDRRREIVIGLLALVWLFTVAGALVLLASLLAKSGTEITGRELLLSAGVVLFTNAVAFGLAFWELDCGGPVARALAPAREKPDFQFPQDDNPDVARDDWEPRLWDYLYVSMTNTMAFSPTDTLPLTRSAKRLMAAESLLSGLTILLVAARAVNILK